MTKKFTVTSSRDREEHLKGLQSAIDARFELFTAGKINDNQYWFYLLGLYKAELEILLDGEINDRLGEIM